jgi:hypothetical protein
MDGLLKDVIVAAATPIAVAFALTITICFTPKASFTIRLVSVGFVIGAASCIAVIAFDVGDAYDGLVSALDGPKELKEILRGCINVPGYDEFIEQVDRDITTLTANPIPLQSWQISLTIGTTLGLPMVSFAWAVLTGRLTSAILPLGIAAAIASAMATGAARARKIDPPDEILFVIDKSFDGVAPYIPTDFDVDTFSKACPGVTPWITPGVLSGNWNALQKGLSSAETLGFTSTALALTAAGLVTVGGFIPSKYMPLSTQVL